VAVQLFTALHDWKHADTNVYQGSS